MSAPATPKIANGRKSRRDDILLCFTSKVASNGYDEVSLREIAEELDLSKGTILHHFRSKDALLEEVMSDYMERLIAGLTSIEERFESPVEQLAGVTYQLMMVQEVDRDATVACSREISRFVRRDVMKDVRRLRDEYESKVREIVSRGMRSGEFLEADQAIVTLQIFGMCNWSWTWFKPGRQWRGIDIAHEFIDTLFSGLTASESVIGKPDHERIAAAVDEIVRANTG